jgi:precorrin-2 dehydrogenase/sirohydrochlorin ferrochelatase
VEAGAEVTVVSPLGTAELRKMADSQLINWRKRDFIESDIGGNVLVIGATDTAEINERVYASAREAGIPANIVDEPKLCDFFVPAVLRRGRLTVTVSTGGASPALAAQLRDDLSEVFGPEYGTYVALVGDFRRRVRERLFDPEERQRAYDRLFDSNVLDRLRGGEEVDIERLVADYAS